MIVDAVRVAFGAAVVPRPPTEGEQRRIAILAELYHRLTGHAAPRIPGEVQEEPLVNGYGRYNGVFSAPSLAGDFAVGAAAVLAVLVLLLGVAPDSVHRAALVIFRQIAF